MALWRSGEDVMAGILDFMHRNARIAVALGVVVGAVGAAGAIGWLTAPV